MKQTCRLRQCVTWVTQTLSPSPSKPIPRKKRNIVSEVPAEEKQERPGTPESGEIQEDSENEKDNQVTNNDGNENGNTSDASSASSVKKPRIRISLAMNGSSKKENVASDEDDGKETNNDNSDTDSDDNNSRMSPPKYKREKTEVTEKINSSGRPKRKRKPRTMPDESEYQIDDVSSSSNLSKLKKRRKKARENSDTEDENTVDSIQRRTRKSNVNKEDRNNEDENNSSKLHYDIDTLKKESSELDGSFTAARVHFTKRGAWVLPKTAEDRFYDLAKHTLVKMCRLDEYSIFADKVTDDEAPGYSSMVKEPMDFGTMRTKLEEGTYGEGQEALTAFYNDFLLVMDNCALYNDEDSEVAQEAARVMALLPEAFATACAAVSDKTKRKRKRKKKEH